MTDFLQGWWGFWAELYLKGVVEFQIVGWASRYSKHTDAQEQRLRRKCRVCFDHKGACGGPGWGRVEWENPWNVKRWQRGWGPAVKAFESSAPRVWTSPNSESINIWCLEVTGKKSPEKSKLLLKAVWNVRVEYLIPILVSSPEPSSECGSTWSLELAIGLSELGL